MGYLCSKGDLNFVVQLHALIHTELLEPLSRRAISKRLRLQLKICITLHEIASKRWQTCYIWLHDLPLFPTCIHAGHQITSKMPGGKDTWEYETFFENQDELADQLADTPGITVSLSNELYARQMIEMVVRDEANTHGPGITEIMRVKPILAAVLKKIEINPKRYDEFRATMLSPNVGVDSDVVDRFVPEKGVVILQ